MKELLVVLVVAVLAHQVSAANIVWDPAHNIMGDSDISTEGTIFAAENVGDSASTTINGVTFSGWNNSGLISYSATDSYVGFGGSGVSDEYKTLLNGASWDDSGSYNITVSGLTIGEEYLVQIWFNSQMGSPLSENVFSIDSVSGSTNSVLITSNTGSGLGQYAQGRFTAVADQQVFGIENVDGNGNPGLNAIQVRSVPEAASVGMLSFGAGLLLLARRFRCI